MLAFAMEICGMNNEADRALKASVAKPGCQGRGVVAAALAALTLWTGVAIAAPPSQGGTLLRAVVLNMGSDAPRITDPRYDRYFKQGTAVAGVAAVIAAGQFRINGLPLPANEAEFRRLTSAAYQINQVDWLTYDGATQTWKGGYHAQQTADSYAAAALAVATGIVPGLEVRLYDRDGDQWVDAIDVDYLEGVQVQSILRDPDGSVRILRGDIDTAQRTADEGRAFDGTHFTATSGERIAAAQFDPTIQAGDVALFWWGPQGWSLRRAREVKGLFIDGRDHESYTIDDSTFADAMRFSRDNLVIANRPGEFVNAQKFFGLNGRAQGRAVHLWLAPTTDPTAQGAPVGLTSGANARAFLAQALARARQELASAVPSRDGSEVPAHAQWVPPAMHDQLRQAIARAQLALEAPDATASLLDYQVYLLYLTLHGSADDVGARFGGFRYTGFLRAKQGGRTGGGRS